jgi:hypothetical protein
MIEIVNDQGEQAAPVSAIPPPVVLSKEPSPLAQHKDVQMQIEQEEEEVDLKDDDVGDDAAMAVDEGESALHAPAAPSYLRLIYDD